MARYNMKAKGIINDVTYVVRLQKLDLLSGV